MTDESPRHLLHPLLAHRLQQAGPGPDDGAVLSASTLEALWAPAGPPPTWPVQTEDLQVQTAAGPVPVRVYRRTTGARRPRPCLVWVHGGAFVAGDLEGAEADGAARGIAAGADAVVVSVDYRLCVDGVHFPAPHDDVVAVARWVQQSADELGVDAARIAVGGASAGANLAAGAALRLRDEATPAWQLLLAYPTVHAALPEPAEELAEAMTIAPASVLFTPQVVNQMNTNFVGMPPESAPRYAFPGTGEDLTGLPPTYIDDSEFDSLRSSGERFAEQLVAAGVDVEYVVSTGVFHGHLAVVGLDRAQVTVDRMARRLTQY